MTKAETILNMLDTAEKINAWRLDDLGSRENELEVVDWDSTATDECDIPDIVIEGTSFTIFYDELEDSTITSNGFIIGDKLFEVI